MRYGYARVSSADQTPALQLDALAAAGCDRVWTDHVSGTVAHRPGLDEVLDRLRAGDELVVWRMDRLGRSLAHLIATVTDLGAREVGFRSLCDQLDTTTAGGRLVFHVLGAISEFEAGLCAERTHAGLQAARARGRVGGRPPAMTAAKLDIARRMLAEGQSKTLAAATIGVSRPTLYAHLAGH